MDRKPPQQTEDHAYAARPRETRLCLTVALGPQKPFVVALPPDGVVSVGRDPQASLGLANPTLSRLHFALDGLAGDVTVRDLGSRNGTLLEGARLGEAPVPLPLGAEIVAGEGRFSLIRRTSLPHGARAFELVSGFEVGLVALRAAAKSPVAIAAIELSAPFHESPDALTVLAQLPPEALLGLVSDTTLLLAAPTATTAAWLVDALAQRASRHATLLLTDDRTDAVPRILRQLLAAPSSSATEDDHDVPPAFRYPSLRKIHADLRRIAPRPISVLVTGETGTGKEVVAREIHRLSRRKGPLVAVNTAALPEALIESELFGHERGAFSGAVGAKAGLLETADKGTLFLDEIGELPLALQAKLLRVLEEQSVRRVGANVERKVDLRIVAATHQDLEGLVRERRFRQDLLFRLNGALLLLPPLRERRDEIPALARHLLEELSNGSPPLLSASAQSALAGYAFPGNVRELKQMLSRALAFADHGVIEVEHLPHTVKPSARAPATERPVAAPDVRASVRDFERERIVEALAQAGGNRTRAAEILGLPRRTLLYKLSKMRLSQE
ncbi:sigma 54-interacting transcriptional regulator [Polyangium sp. y55x31]|uniref:sigma 54-interacting transcriptional regulator n=1 Tax=Polyangium sp. y55x31 TaxID=3042688 RepID=UPI0024825E31|nr:sigma 54-interacting transcriptional regulator [Polyangium sp. y55x31]MDI1476877.1 sigma 54-interacting transcriptional regulator [Polyangium sp. y55x31]